MSAFSSVVVEDWTVFFKDFLHASSLWTKFIVLYI